MFEQGMKNKMNVQKQFIKYVSQNVLGMLGVSFYILADTFFISMAEGANGITALNLVLPLYSVIYAIAAMIGVGSAIRFSILRAQKDGRADCYFSHAVLLVVGISLIFVIAGAFFPKQIVALLGGDASIVAVGASYTQVFMMFAPFFMLNSVFNAFVRNDGDPSLAMCATLFSSLFNIVFDYILMFPCGMGMTGAALATGFSPVVGTAICSIHFLKKTNTLRFIWQKPSLTLGWTACKLGVSAFIGEMSSGVTTAVFNWLILDIAGNIGVAAYGVVANIALVAISVFNGIAQGGQPLISDYYGSGKVAVAQKVLRMSILTSIGTAMVMMLGIFFFAKPIVAVFNSEQSVALASYAEIGIRLYFIGFFFAGVNIVGTGFLSATNQAVKAFICSVLRGLVAIVVCAVILASCFGMNGVWLSFAAAELVSLVATTYSLGSVKKIGFVL